MKAFPLGMFFLLLIGLLSHPAEAQHTHPPGLGVGEGKKGQTAGDPETSTTRAFLLEGNIKAVFSITPIAEHKKMLLGMKMKVEVDPRGTHNIAVTLTDTRSNLPISDAVVKMKVIDPTGKEQIKLLDSIPAMNQYAQDFILTEKGRYQVLILFRNAGQKRAAGFYYLKK